MNPLLPPLYPFPRSNFLFFIAQGPQTSGETIESTKSLNFLHGTQIASPENSSKTEKKELSLSLRDDQFLLKLKGKVPLLTCLTILILKLDVDTVKIDNIVDTIGCWHGGT